VLQGCRQSGGEILTFHRSAGAQPDRTIGGVWSTVRVDVGWPRR